MAMAVPARAVPKLLTVALDKTALLGSPGGAADNRSSVYPANQTAPLDTASAGAAKPRFKFRARNNNPGPNVFPLAKPI
jgi:hypothetical protein